MHIETAATCLEALQLPFDHADTEEGAETSWHAQLFFTIEEQVALALTKTPLRASEAQHIRAQAIAAYQKRCDESFANFELLFPPPVL